MSLRTVWFRTTSQRVRTVREQIDAVFVAGFVAVRSLRPRPCTIVGRCGA